MNPRSLAVAALACAALSASAFARDVDATFSPENGYGPNPILPEADKDIIPTVDVAKATGWAAGQMPKAAEGLTVAQFASGLDRPRPILVLPNGDVLVAETNAPERPEEGKGIKGKAMQMMIKRPAAPSQAPTGSRCSATPTATGRPR